MLHSTKNTQTQIYLRLTQGDIITKDTQLYKKMCSVPQLLCELQVMSELGWWTGLCGLVWIGRS